MNIDSIKEEIERGKNMASALGMQFWSTEDENTCKATMTVDERTCQPYGTLNGGASLALAENLAGVGSQALCHGCKCIGINVTAQHVKTALLGDTVTATATIIHRGHTLHVWRVDIKDSTGDIVSTINVTNFIFHH